MKLWPRSVSDGIAIAQLAIACVFLSGATQLSFGSSEKPGPGVTPFVFALILVFCSILSLLKQPADAEPLPKGKSGRTVAAIAALALLYPVSVHWMGFPLSTFVLVAATARLLRMSTWQAVFLAFVSVGASYLLFKILLGVPFPRGLPGL